MPSRLNPRTHNDFSKGVMRDVPAYKLPEGYVWEAQNVFITREGSLQKRFGVRLCTNTQQITSTSSHLQAIGFAGGVALTTPMLYVGANDGTTAKFWSTPAGTPPLTLVPASTSGFDSTVKGTPGVPTLYSGQSIFPVFTQSVVLSGINSPFVALGGTDLQTSRPAQATSAGSVTVTANSRAMTLATPVTGMSPGQYIHVAGASNEYTGRIITVVSTTSIEVEQVPTTTFTGTGSIYTAAVMCGTRIETGSTAAQIPGSAECLTVYQNRIVCGGVVFPGFVDSYQANTIQWSTLFTSGQDSPVTGSDGLVPFTKAGWPKRNFERFNNLNKIVALVPYGINQLIVFADNGIAVVSGGLGTITADSSSSSYSVKYLSTDVGCLSGRSVQVTPYGVVFASRDGIYITDGNSLTNILNGKLASEYSNAITKIGLFGWGAATQATGSALLDNRIYMFGITGTRDIDEQIGTLFIDLANNFSITSTPHRQPVANANYAEQIYLYMSVKEPGSSRVYGIHNLPTRANYTSITRLDRILFPEITSDASNLEASYDFYDTTLAAGQQRVYATIQTKAYADNDPIGLKRFRHTQIQALIQQAMYSSTGSSTANNYLLVYYTSGLDGFMQAYGTRQVPAVPNSTFYSLGTLTKPAAQSLILGNAFNDRFDTQVIAPGISYIITDQTGDGVAVAATEPPIFWELQEIGITHNTLRRGRTWDGNYLG